MENVTFKFGRLLVFLKSSRDRNFVVGLMWPKCGNDK